MKKKFQKEEKKWKARNYFPTFFPFSEQETKEQREETNNKTKWRMTLNILGAGCGGHICNPSTLGGGGGWLTWAQEFMTSLGNMAKPHLYKNTKFSQAWWWAPVIPATPEAEAGESLGPRRWRLQWAKIAPLHSILGNKSENSFSKSKTKNHLCCLVFPIYRYLVK